MGQAERELRARERHERADARAASAGAARTEKQQAAELRPQVEERVRRFLRAAADAGYPGAEMTSVGGWWSKTLDVTLPKRFEYRAAWRLPTDLYDPPIYLLASGKVQDRGDIKRIRRLNLKQLRTLDAGIRAVARQHEIDIGAS